MKKITFLLIVGVMILNSCTTLKVNSDYDKEVDFSKFKTYSYFGWTEESDKLVNEFDKKRIEEAFAAEFEKRELKHTEKDGDLIVSLFIQVDKKTQTTAYTDHYRAGGLGGYYGGYYYNPGWGWGAGHSTTRYHDHDYLVGTLVIDVFSSSTKKLIWQAVASSTVDEDPQTRENNTPKTISKIMESFPIKPVKE